MFVSWNMCYASHVCVVRVPSFLFFELMVYVHACVPCLSVALFALCSLFFICCYDAVELFCLFLSALSGLFFNKHVLLVNILYYYDILVYHTMCVYIVLTS